MGAINATRLGSFVLVLMVIMGYYLGKRKTETPVLTTMLAILLFFTPPLALFLMILGLKRLCELRRDIR